MNNRKHALRRPKAHPSHSLESVSPSPFVEFHENVTLDGESVTIRKQRNLSTGTKSYMLEALGETMRVSDSRSTLLAWADAHLAGKLAGIRAQRLDEVAKKEEVTA